MSIPPPSDFDDITPVERPVWTMRPEAPRVASRPSIPETGDNQRALEKILETVEAVLRESRDIKEYGQKCCQIAIDAVNKIPDLEKRMTRVELLVALVTIVSILTLLTLFAHGPA